GTREFTRLAAELGFEHHVVEGQWQRWSDAELRDVIADATAKGVGIWLWRHSRTLMDPVERRAFFAMVRDAGAVGVKVDFLDHEAREVVDRYEAILEDAARLRLMVDFHGANKPTGQARTWPNELTREGVKGLEYRRTEAWATHNTTLPFTRLLAGPADYTPLVFNERRKETSAAHQVATAVVFTSPLLVLAAHPARIQESPAGDVIRAIPAVWDETRVLPPSAIGELAVFARRRGATWFLAVLNGPEGRTLRVPLSFLGKGNRDARLVRDVAEDPAALRVEARRVSARDTVDITLRPAGGFVGLFVDGPSRRPRKVGQAGGR
ncbi:MAG TPA: glycoside hydrolase family 97 catalytic domain-containing protein, partial [Vicinamibacteria bacterium]|nr:glycoside hydrolase family 97 catalytic domain-containing protein [Vicinamibacteria bacterium]